MTPSLCKHHSHFCPQTSRPHSKLISIQPRALHSLDSLLKVVAKFPARLGEEETLPGYGPKGCCGKILCQDYLFFCFVHRIHSLKTTFHFDLTTPRTVLYCILYTSVWAVCVIIIEPTFLPINNGFSFTQKESSMLHTAFMCEYHYFSATVKQNRTGF